MLRPLAPPARMHAREALPLYGMCTQSCIRDVFRRELHATLRGQRSGVLRCLWLPRVVKGRCVADGRHALARLRRAGVCTAKCACGVSINAHLIKRRA
jgi:hypothetical protein